MKNQLWLVIWLGLFTLLLVACRPQEIPLLPTFTAPAASSPTFTLVIGDISDDPGEVIEGSQPLVDYLVTQLQPFGYTRGEVRVVTTMDEMVDLLRSGQVDLYFDSVYPATLISDASGAEIILRRWRYGVESYHSVIFARKDSGIASLQDLAGKMIALDAPYSTSGFFLPAVTLLDEGLVLAGKSSYDEPVASNEVGFVFSYDDQNTLQWVLRGLTAAGATDDYNYNVAFPQEARDQFLVITTTDSVPRQVVLVRPGMDPTLLDAIKLALITADETAAGQAALKPFQTTQFDEFPDGITTAQEQMRTLMERVRAIPLP